MTTVTTKISLEGPIFTHDPKKTIRTNIHAMLEEVAESGAHNVQAQLTPGHGWDATGRDAVHLRDYVIGRVESLSGRPWALHAVVSAVTLQRQLRAHSYIGRVERRYRMFARAYRAISSSRPRLADELAKGLE
jgi:hypothetical protein